MVDRKRAFYALSFGLNLQFLARKAATTGGRFASHGVIVCAYVFRFLICLVYCKLCLSCVCLLCFC